MRYLAASTVGAAHQTLAGSRIESSAKIPKGLFINRHPAPDKAGATRPPRSVPIMGIVIVAEFRACLPVGILGIVRAGSAAATECMKGCRHSALAERYRQIFSCGSLGPALKRPTNLASSSNASSTSFCRWINTRWRSAVSKLWLTHSPIASSTVILFAPAALATALARSAVSSIVNRVVFALIIPKAHLHGASCQVASNSSINNG